LSFSNRSLGSFFQRYYPQQKKSNGNKNKIIIAGSLLIAMFFYGNCAEEGFRSLTSASITNNGNNNGNGGNSPPTPVVIPKLKLLGDHAYDQIAFYGSNKVFRADDYTYFLADDGTHGSELWVYDGIKNTFQMVLDATPGKAPGMYGRIFPGHNELFFTVSTDPANYFGIGNTIYNSKLYYVDSAHKVTLVKEVPNGQVLDFDYSTQAQAGLITVNKFNPSLTEVWLYRNGQTPVLVVSGAGIMTSNLLFFNNKFYFGMFGDTQVPALAAYDGTLSIVRTGVQVLNMLGVVNNVFLFAGYNETENQEVWRSDGTTAGTVMMPTSTIGNGFTSYEKPIVFKNRMYFCRKQNLSNVGAYSTDGLTVAKLINDPVQQLSVCEISQKSPNYLFFTDGTPWYFTDGASIRSFSGNYESPFAVRNTTAYYQTYDDALATYVYSKKDLTTLVASPFFSPPAGQVLGLPLQSLTGIFFPTLAIANPFAATPDDSAMDLHYADDTGIKSILTKTNIVMLGSNRDKLLTGTYDPATAAYTPSAVDTAGQVSKASAVLNTNERAPYGWNSNNSAYNPPNIIAVIGDVQVRIDHNTLIGFNVKTGAFKLLAKENLYRNIPYGDANPRAYSNFYNNYNLAYAGTNSAYLLSSDGIIKTDGTAAGTQKFFTGNANLFCVINNNLIYSDTNGYYVTNGTAAGTVKLPTFSGSSRCVKTSTKAYFVDYANSSNGVTTVYETDGTAAGTKRLLSVNGIINALAPFGDNLMAATFNNIFFIDTAASTSLNVFTAPQGQTPFINLDPVNNRQSSSFYFAVTAPSADALSTTQPKQIYKSDGTVAGTTLVTTITDRIYTTATDSGNLFMLIVNATNDLSLNKLDVVQNSVTKLADLGKTPEIRQGEVVWSSLTLLVRGAKIYYRANDKDLGTEFHVYDLATNTKKVLMDLNPMTASSNPQFARIIGNYLYFMGTHDTFGQELWGYDLN
jgi:ELWxxDGT repeat protein